MREVTVSFQSGLPDEWNFEPCTMMLHGDTEPWTLSSIVSQLVPETTGPVRFEFLLNDEPYRYSTLSACLTANGWTSEREILLTVVFALGDYRKKGEARSGDDWICSVVKLQPNHLVTASADGKLRTFLNDQNLTSIQTCGLGERVLTTNRRLPITDFCTSALDNKHICFATSCPGGLVRLGIFFYKENNWQTGPKVREIRIPGLEGNGKKERRVTDTGVTYTSGEMYASVIKTHLSLEASVLTISDNKGRLFIYELDEKCINDDFNLNELDNTTLIKHTQAKTEDSSAKLLNIFRPHQSSITGILHCPEFPHVIFTCSTDGTCKVISFETGQIVCTTSIGDKYDYPNSIILLNSESTEYGIIGTLSVSTFKGNIYQLQLAQAKVAGSLDLLVQKSDELKKDDLEMIVDSTILSKEEDLEITPQKRIGETINDKRPCNEETSIINETEEVPPEQTKEERVLEALDCLFDSEKIWREKDTDYDENIQPRLKSKAVRGQIIQEGPKEWLAAQAKLKEEAKIILDSDEEDDIGPLNSELEHSDEDELEPELPYSSETKPVEKTLKKIDSIALRPIRKLTELDTTCMYMTSDKNLLACVSQSSIIQLIDVHKNSSPVTQLNLKNFNISSQPSSLAIDDNDKRQILYVGCTDGTLHYIESIKGLPIE